MEKSNKEEIAIEIKSLVKEYKMYNYILNNDIFDVTLISKKVAVGDYPDDVLWDNLIEDIKNI